jgi:hypothetical protein
MAGVGKIGLVILVLVLCAPAAARLSRHSGTGQAFSLPEWLMNVCHHRPGPRGTQRRNPQHPTEPLNAVVEQESRRGFHGNVLRPQVFIPGPVAALPAFIFPAVSITPAIPASDPVFRCTFLI